MIKIAAPTALRGLDKSGERQMIRELGKGHQVDMAVAMPLLFQLDYQHIVATATD